jgi:predicted methyltransferase
MEQIIHGDCLEVLKGLPDESVHCCVTSPPYLACAIMALTVNWDSKKRRRNTSRKWSRYSGADIGARRSKKSSKKRLSKHLGFILSNQWPRPINKSEGSQDGSC